MASYGAVIEVSVRGQEALNKLEGSARRIESLIQGIKQQRNIFDQSIGTEQTRNLKRNLENLVASFAQAREGARQFKITIGGKERTINMYSKTLAGLNEQLNTFESIANNATVGTEQYRFALTAANKVANEFARTQAKAASESTKLSAANVGEALALGKSIPDSIDGLNLYLRVLEDVLRTLKIGSNDFRIIEDVIASTNQRLSSARLAGQVSQITPAAGPATQLDAAAYEKRASFAKAVADQEYKLLTTGQQIVQAKLKETQQEELQNRLAQASEALARGELDIAKRLTNEIRNQRIAYDRANRAQEALMRPTSMVAGAAESVTGRRPGGLPPVPGSRAAWLATGGVQETPRTTPAKTQVDNELASRKRLNNLLNSAQIIEQKVIQLKARGVNLSTQELAIENILNSIQQNSSNITKEYLDALDGVLNSLRNELKLQKEILTTQKQQQQQQQQAKAPGVVPAGGFPVAGPATSPGFRQTQKEISRLGESLALGAGFPLLFGAGAGSVTGSVLGSFVGSGFGGQILGGALGQILDQAVQKTAQLGSAMQALDLSKIEQSGIRINANLETQISLMLQAGNLAGAQEAIQQRVLNVTGALPGTIEGISDGVNLLSNSWSEFTAAAGVTLSIIGTPFAVALSAALELVNSMLRGINLIASGIGQVIKVTGEWIVRVLGGEQVLAAINDYLKQNNQELEQSRAAYAPILAELNGQVLLTREILDLEKQKTTSNKERNAALSYGQKLLQIDAEIDKEIRAEKEKQTQATAGLVAEKIRLLNVTRDQKKEEAAISYELERRRLLEQAEEARRRQAEQAQKASLSATKAILDERLKLVDINIREQEVFVNEEAGLRRSLELTGARARLIEQVLTYERKMALQEAAKNNTTKQVLALFELRRKNLQYELNTQQEITRQRLAQIAVDKFVATQTAVINAVKPLQEARKEQERQLESARKYYRLVTEGMLPAEAERIINFEQTVQKQLESVAEQIKLTEATILEAEARGANVDKLREQLDLLKKSQEAIRGEAAKGPGEAPSPRDRLIGEIGQVQGQLNQLLDPVNQITAAAESIGTAFGESFKGIVSGSMTAQQALANFFQSVADHFLDMAAQIIAKWIQMTILNSILKLFPGGNGGNAATALGINTPDLQKYAPLGTGVMGVDFPTYANGGMPPVGRPSIVGERGPELFVPRSSGTIVPNNQLGGTTNVVVNVDAKGSNVQGNDTDARQLGRAISAAVQAELVKQQRPGGLLANAR